jgi:hypothetical protein
MNDIWLIVSIVAICIIFLISGGFDYYRRGW